MMSSRIMMGLLAGVLLGCRGEAPAPAPAGEGPLLVQFSTSESVNPDILYSGSVECRDIHYQVENRGKSPVLILDRSRFRDSERYTQHVDVTLVEERDDVFRAVVNLRLMNMPSATDGGMPKERFFWMRARELAPGQTLRGHLIMKHPVEEVYPYLSNLSCTDTGQFRDKTVEIRHVELAIGWVPVPPPEIQRQMVVLRGERMWSLEPPPYPQPISARALIKEDAGASSEVVEERLWDFPDASHGWLQDNQHVVSVTKDVAWRGWAYSKVHPERSRWDSLFGGKR